VLKGVTSCGGTSNETVLRSTLVYVSVHGMMKNRPRNNNNVQAGPKNKPQLFVTILSNIDRFSKLLTHSLAN